MRGIFIEAIRRLYKDGKISREKVEGLLESKKISPEDMEYILGKKE